MDFMKQIKDIAFNRLPFTVTSLKPNPNLPHAFCPLSVILSPVEV